MNVMAIGLGEQPHGNGRASKLRQAALDYLSCLGFNRQSCHRRLALPKALVITVDRTSAAQICA
jgi:hypothetical protein